MLSPGVYCAGQAAGLDVDAGKLVSGLPVPTEDSAGS